MTTGLTFEYQTAWIIVCVLAGLVFAFGLYFKDKHRQEFSTSLKMLLGTSRFLVATFLAFLLLSPYIKTSFTETQKPIVVLLQDNSASIKTVWKQGDSSNYAQNISQLIANLEIEFEVKTYAFGENITESGEWHYKEKLTDIAGALNAVGNLYNGRNLGAVVLATDGIYNKGNSPIYINKSLSAPIFTVALGDTTPRKDLKIDKVLHNRLVYLGDQFKIEIKIFARNCIGSKSALVISNVGTEGSSKTLFNKPIEISDDLFEQSMEVVLDAEKEGLQQFTISLSQVKGEFTTTNNYTSIFVDVLKARQKITLIAHSPHPDLTGIKQAVESNKNYELEIVLADQFEESSLKEINLAILHQLPGSNIPVSKLLKKLSDQKTPTLFVLGSQTSIPAFNKCQSAVQIIQNASNQNEVQATFDEDFSLFTLSNQTINQLQSLPPLVSPFGDYKVSPNSIVAFHQKIGVVETTYPLLLFNEQLEMKQAVLAAEGIWRWRMIDYLNNKNHDATNEFVTKVVQYMTVKVDNRQFRVTMAKNIFTENELIHLDAELYNDAYELVNSSEASVSIYDQEGQEFPYIFSKTQNAYTLYAGSMGVGNYSFNARVNFNGKDYTHSGQFSVSPLQLEASRTTADHQLLYALSKQYGGNFYYPNQLEELTNQIRQNESMKPILYNRYRVQSFINLRWILLVLVVLLGLEWFARKYNGVY